jgi:hypothetical protein
VLSTLERPRSCGVTEGKPAGRRGAGGCGGRRKRRGGCDGLNSFVSGGARGRQQFRDAPGAANRRVVGERLKSTLSCPSRARQRRVERRPFAAASKSYGAKESPVTLTPMPTIGGSMKLLEPVSGAAARALRDSTRRGFIRRDAHFPGMPYSRDSAATRSENCGVKYRYQRRCVVDRFHFGASARNAANSVAACSLRPASA